jgi:Kinesin motor domain
MTPPTTLAPGMTNSRVSTLAARRQTFSFTQVFAPETSQSTFFTNTTLPLIKDLLNGESGLIFAYGVTNSGKTYTIQGKNNLEEAGILPRALDVVFNSIQGLQVFILSNIFLLPYHETLGNIGDIRRPNTRGRVPLGPDTHC